MTFGDLLKSYREGIFLTQDELAREAGLSRRGISDLERGARRAPHPQTVERLARALDLSEDSRARLLMTIGRQRLGGLSEADTDHAVGAAATAERARIMIVDDQPANVALLEDLLQQAGYTQVRSSTDPRTAAALFGEFQPDLVVLDLIMPHLDGFGVLAQLQPLVRSESFLPILVLTADGSQAPRRRALAAGATDFLSKPLDTTEVLIRIRTLLRTRALHCQLQGQNAQLEERVRERTRELEEAHAQVLELYRELALRNQHLHDVVERLVRAFESGQRVAAPSSSDRTDQRALRQLTTREQEVLRLLAQGRTNAEIARDLAVGLDSITSRVEHIIAKLDVADRNQAAVRAVELGLFSATLP